MAETNPADGYLVYGDAENQHRKAGNLIGRQDAGSLIQKIEKKR